jgi:hypothetical protein
METPDQLVLAHAMALQPDGQIVAAGVLGTLGRNCTSR